MIDLTPILLVYLVLAAAGQGLEILAERLNAGRTARHGAKVPAAVYGWIDADDLARSARYNRDRIGFARIRTLAAAAVFLFLLLSGLLQALDGRLEAIGPIWSGLIFFGAIGLLLFGVDLPFDYYAAFVLEEKYGFNTRTKRTWIADTVKASLLSAAISSILLCAVLLLIRFAGGLWWVWAWAVVFAVQLGLAAVYPTIIAPIFNTFTPVADPELDRRIRALADRAGIRVRRIDQMDASRRTRHTNAYFAGLGRTRSIVLYDSLLAAHDPEEVISILAHEIGHLKKRHIPKQLLLAAGLGLAAFAAAGALVSWPGLYAGFGFAAPSAYAGLLLAGMLLQTLSVFASPAAAAVSRRFEREADRYAAELTGSPAGMCRALKRMAKDNLTFLFPHPLYVALHFSHPPILERLKRLGCREDGREELEQNGRRTCEKTFS